MPFSKKNKSEVTSLKQVFEDVKMPNNEIIVQKTHEFVVETAKPKFFVFSESEIAGMTKTMRAICDLKKSGVKLDRFAFLKWKLICGVKLAQDQPWILKYIGSLGTRCKICGAATAWAATCTWMDRHYDATIGKKIEKEFSITPVCEKCLVDFQAQYMHHAEWLNIILLNRENAQYERMGNAKTWSCAICNDHSTDSSWLHIPYTPVGQQSLLLTLPVCDKHFDMLVVAKGSNVEALSSIGIAEKLVETGTLSKGVLEELKAFRRLKN